MAGVVGKVGGDAHVDDGDAAIAGDEDVIAVGLSGDPAVHVPGHVVLHDRARSRPRAGEMVDEVAFVGGGKRRGGKQGQPAPRMREAASWDGTPTRR
ncbi:MAG: hypothetical protein WDM84_00095 [Bauldia sp.]